MIVQDMGVLRVIHQCFPDLDIHASTQMTLTSGMGVDDRLAAYGVTRIVPARELSLTEPAANAAADEDGVGSVCTWCIVLLLFRSMFDEQYAGWS